MKRNFGHLDSYTFVQLHYSLVMSNLEHVISVWNFNNEYLIEEPYKL